MEGKKRLIPTLLMAIDKDVKDSLVISAGYRAGVQQF